MRRWAFAFVGAVLGLAVGLTLAFTTDLPLAPEIGAVIGGVGGYFVGR